MNDIKVLDFLTSSKIAAGEVIERPAGVLKELLENSIDAGATAINIDIAQAGKKLIRVNDNGVGIKEEDLKTALELTCLHRGSEKVLSQIPDLIAAIKNSENLHELWLKYSKKMPYAANVSFEQAVEKVEELLNKCC